MCRAAMFLSYLSHENYENKIPLPPGTNPGTLGAHGMGEINRTHDNKLNRTVAIKIPPRNLANDSDSLTRFQREAKPCEALSR